MNSPSFHNAEISALVMLLFGRRALLLLEVCFFFPSDAAIHNVHQFPTFTPPLYMVDTHNQTGRLPRKALHQAHGSPPLQMFEGCAPSLRHNHSILPCPITVEHNTFGTCYCFPPVQNTFVSSASESCHYVVC